MNNFTKLTTEVTIKPTAAGIYDDKATTIALHDDGDGNMFICISQKEDESVAIDPEEWPLVRDAIEQLLGQL